MPDVKIEKMLRILQEVECGHSIEEAAASAAREYNVDPHQDLNKLDDTALDKKKKVWLVLRVRLLVWQKIGSLKTCNENDRRNNSAYAGKEKNFKITLVGALFCYEIIHSTSLWQSILYFHHEEVILIEHYPG